MGNALKHILSLPLIYQPFSLPNCSEQPFHISPFFLSLKPPFPSLTCTIYLGLFFRYQTMFRFLEIEGAAVGFYCEHSKRQSFTYPILYVLTIWTRIYIHLAEWYKNNSKGIFISLIIRIQNSLACRWSRQLSSR